MNRDDMKRSRDCAVIDIEVDQDAKRVKEGGSRRAVCEYGINCYRRNPHHFQEFKHVPLETKFMELITSGLSSPAAGNLTTFPNSSVARSQLEMLFTVKSDMLTVIRSDTEDPVEPKTLNQTPDSSTTSNANASANIISSSGTSATSSQSSTQQKSQQRKANDPLSKWESSSPFNFFLTDVPRDKNTPYSMSFKELFHPSFGEVKTVCHFNFMVEPDWYLDEIQGTTINGSETTIVHGVDSPELDEATRVFPWLSCHLVKSPFPFGHHHTKMSILEYCDGSMRFLVYTANLIESDWYNRTQGIWISPKCPPMSDSPMSTTGSLFKAHFIEYLGSYPSKCGLAQWISRIRKIDTSEIKVVFIGSVPVTSQSTHNGLSFGVKKMEGILKRFKPPAQLDASWPLFIQCSSIGSLGATDEWIHGEFGRLLGSSPLAWKPSTPIKLVYPTDQNVRHSEDGIQGGGCLPYSKSTHTKQPWLKNGMYQWKNDLRSRSRNMPHIKTYGRLSPDGTQLAWFLLTSANLSKAAWGKLNKAHDKLTLMSWEAGVLFVPQLFGFNDPFVVSKTAVPSEGEFVLPFDVPLVKYGPKDEPWHMETLRDANT